MISLETNIMIQKPFKIWFYTITIAFYVFIRDDSFISVKTFHLYSCYSKISFTVCHLSAEAMIYSPSQTSEHRPDLHGISAIRSHAPVPADIV